MRAIVAASICTGGLSGKKMKGARAVVDGKPEHAQEAAHEGRALEFAGHLVGMKDPPLFSDDEPFPLDLATRIGNGVTTALATFADEHRISSISSLPTRNGAREGVTSLTTRVRCRPAAAPNPSDGGRQVESTFISYKAEYKNGFRDEDAE
jgi:hypothetical protein